MATYRRDLTEGGTYFFTLALQDRSKDWLTRYINELRAAFIETQQRYPFKQLPSVYYQIIFIGSWNYLKMIIVMPPEFVY